MEFLLITCGRNSAVASDITYSSDGVGVVARRSGKTHRSFDQYVLRSTDFPKAALLLIYLCGIKVELRV